MAFSFGGEVKFEYLNLISSVSALKTPFKIVSYRSAAGAKNLLSPFENTV